jgi:hypothetical protein
MNNLIVSLKVIAPLMLYMLMGVALKKSGKLPEKLNTDINKLLVTVFLPFLMFKNIYNADLSGINGKFGLYAGIATIIGWCACFLLCSIVEKDPAKVGSMVQGMFRSNAVIFGIPVAESLFGVGNTVEVALALAICVPIYNTLSVVVLEICGQKAAIAKGKAGAGKTKLNGKSILLGIAKNKLIWGALLGFLVNALNLDLPDVLDSVVAGMSGVITPMAFITLGASFSLRSAKNNRRDLVLVTLVKLVIYPLLYMLLPIHWGWSGYVMGAMLLTSASPTAISSYPMAKAMGCDGDLSGEIVVVTSVFSILTMFLWIFGLKQFGLL